MAFASLVAFSSLTTALIALAIGIDIGQPLLYALAPIKDLQAFYFQPIIAGSVGLLATDCAVTVLALTSESALLIVESWRPQVRFIRSAARPSRPKNRPSHFL